MDEQAQRSARTRAAIAFGLAGVLLVVNVVAAVAWGDGRRDRFDGDRIEFHERTRHDRDRNDDRWQGGQQFGGPMGPGAGPADRGGRGPVGPGGRSDEQGDDGEGRTSDSDQDQEQEGTA